MDILAIEKKLAGREPSLIDIKKANAVLIPLVETEQGVCLLYETRSENIIQPNEVCFPGGSVEEGESPKEAAIRECMEELGVKRSDIRMIAQNDSLHHYGGMMLYSFIAELKTRDFHINPCELSEVFTIPISWLLSHEPEEYLFEYTPAVPDGFDMSVFGIEGKYNWRQGHHRIIVWKYGEHYLWGMTAKLTEHFLKLIR